MKVVFLDIDGVLNSATWIHDAGARLGRRQVCGSADQIDPACVERLNRITDATGAVFVLSSAWRIVHCPTVAKANAFFSSVGVQAAFVGRTGNVGRWRGDQIDSWLRRRGQAVDCFIILDDADDMTVHMHRLVQTSWQTGLQDADVELAIEMLRGGDQHLRR